ncbi:MAG: Cof-type HAD-IIB family hydrolase [Streptococcaceae bacterium]|jgi:Cof subfamily protein (haloacid dehalogenase superfamily)|nr:Cof-type HAD-IIB family hydrolase [Streptococcaceae bacterium]
MIQMIVSDMDGTLLNDEMEMSLENISAIKKAQAAGLTVVVATGRSIEEAAPILHGADIHCWFVTSNGAQIFDQKGNNLLTVGIEADKLAAVMAILRDHRIYFELFTDQGGFTENIETRLASVAQWLKSTAPNLSEAEAFEIAESHMATLPINAIDNFDRVLENPNLTVIKIFAMSQIDDPALLLAKTELAQLSGLFVTSSGANNIEVNHLAAQKGQSLQKVAEMHGIALENVAALGDNFNDMSMIKAAGLGIAMENAEAEVKEIAQHVTRTNTENGVAYAVEQILSGHWQ